MGVLVDDRDQVRRQVRHRDAEGFEGGPVEQAICAGLDAAALPHRRLQGQVPVASLRPPVKRQVSSYGCITMPEPKNGPPHRSKYLQGAKAVGGVTREGQSSGCSWHCARGADVRLGRWGRTRVVLAVGEVAARPRLIPLPCRSAHAPPGCARKGPRVGVGSAPWAHGPVREIRCRRRRAPPAVPPPSRAPVALALDPAEVALRDAVNAARETNGSPNLGIEPRLQRAARNAPKTWPPTGTSHMSGTTAPPSSPGSPGTGRAAAPEKSLSCTPVAHRPAGGATLARLTEPPGEHALPGLAQHGR